MKSGEPDTLLLYCSLAAEVVLASVEERQGVAAAVERGKVQLVEACMAHQPFLAKLEYFRRPVM
jgi:hypothetical protein